MSSSLSCRLECRRPPPAWSFFLVIKLILSTSANEYDKLGDENANELIKVLDLFVLITPVRVDILSVVYSLDNLEGRVCLRQRRSKRDRW